LRERFVVEVPVYCGRGLWYLNLLFNEIQYFVRAKNTMVGEMLKIYINFVKKGQNRWEGY